MPPGILDRMVLDTPIALVDLETTGLCAGPDKVVEVGVARIEPGKPPALVLNTLVHPQRPVAATEIHGITDEDVAAAPTFSEIAGNVAESIERAVVGAYNVYFDARFLGMEFRQVGVRQLPPHLCLMYMRPLLNLGKKCTLVEACAVHGVGGSSAHHAASDVLLSAQLWQVYTTVLNTRGIRTFGDLGSLGTYKFISSFALPLFEPNATRGLPRTQRLKPREMQHSATPEVANIVGEYWEAVLTALADLELSPAELSHLKRRRVDLGLSKEQIRWVHAKAFSGVLAEATQDRAITATEAEALWRIAAALRLLGWAPGDPPSEGREIEAPPPAVGMFGRLREAFRRN
jgi:DNA polymerase-3 subunit epsilon